MRLQIIYFEKYTKTTEEYPNGRAKKLVFGTNNLLVKYSEISFRLIIGTLLIAGSSISLVSLGFAIKIIQKGIS